MGLETAEDQIAVLFSDPIEEQLKDLECMLDEGMGVAVALTKKLDTYYRAGNLAALYALSLGEDQTVVQSKCPMTPEKKHKLLDNRNNNWMDKLPALLKANTNLIAVGALHLVGEEGLLYQLDKMGYKVEAVK